jgi:recombination protein RecR
MLPDPLLHLVELLARLPGVGEKTAQRFALHLVAERSGTARALGEALAQLGERVKSCARCGNIAEVDSTGQAVCGVCRDSRRDGSLLCVVAKVQDLLAIERSGAMRGRYFVLGRLLSPLDGIGPDELPLERLFTRLKEDGVREVIVATPPSVDGEATALLLARELTTRGVSVSRIASGVPHGGDLEFADQITLGRAIEGRRALDSR